MRGDQLAHQWQVTRAIEARPNGLTMAEMPRVVGTGGLLEKALQKPVPKAGMGFLVLATKRMSSSLAVMKPNKMTRGVPLKLIKLLVKFPLLKVTRFLK